MECWRVSIFYGGVSLELHEEKEIPESGTTWVSGKNQWNRGDQKIRFTKFRPGISLWGWSKIHILDMPYPVVMKKRVSKIYPELHPRNHRENRSVLSPRVPPHILTPRISNSEITGICGEMLAGLSLLESIHALRNLESWSHIPIHIPKPHRATSRSLWRR